MTTYDSANRHDTDAIIEAARLGVGVSDLELGKVYAVPDADGNVHVLDLATDAHLAR